MSTSTVTVQSAPWLLLATIALVISKVTGNLDISWWWAFSPLWLSFLVFGAVIGFVCVLALLAAMLK